jgi:hypothetical protein
MSQTYIGIIVMLLATFLPKLGITLGADQLTTTVSVVLTIAGGLWAFWGRYKAGGITWAGIRKG